MNEPRRVFDLLDFQLKKYNKIDIYNSKIDGKWQGISTQDFIHRVNNISKGLYAAGVKPSDKIAVISENRLEWNLLDFAIQQIGAVFVAIYPNISDNDYEYIFNDTEIKLCFVSNDKLFQRLLGIKDKIPTLQSVYSFNSYTNIPHWYQLISLGLSVEDRIIEDLKSDVKEDDLATLIYTSGTTGKPKGVMLSHKNLISDTLSSEYSFPIQSYDKALSFLPTCHAYERVFHYVYIYMGVSIYYAESMDTIGDNLKEIKPNIFSAVPRVLEKIYDKIIENGKKLPTIKKNIFFWSLKLAENYDLDESKLSRWYKIKLSIARKLVFSKWKSALGGNIKGIASGSAPLQEKLIKIYLAAGIPIFEGYGLTEAGPCVAVNCIKRGLKLGTVGLPLINIDVNLAEDGEILVKGNNVMLGYYKNPTETEKILKNGWLYTGDIGEWVDGKFLKIIDRKKEMFKTSGGKYIVPQQIEKKLLESEFIEQAIVIGEGQKFPAVLIVPNFKILIDWVKKNYPNLMSLSNIELTRNQIIIDFFNKIVDISNSNFGNYEKIKKIALLSDEFTIEDGELTPTLKLKRNYILSKYKIIIDKIYK